MAADDDNDDGSSHKPSVVPSVVGGAAAAGIAVRLGSPEVAMGLGAAGRLFESLAEHVWHELRPDAKRRAAEMLSVTAGATGCDAEQLAEMAGATEASRLLTGLAMNAAERTAWPPQVRALGRVLADGLIAETDAVDVPQFALSAMVELGRLHVTMLDLIVRNEPFWGGDSMKARPYRKVPHLPWRAGGRVWTASALVAVRAQLTEVLPGVAGTLVRHGLAEQIDQTQEALEQLGKDFQRQVNQQAAASRRAGGIGMHVPARAPATRGIERSWSPTKLGEKVLGYYLEAGAEEDITKALPAG